MKTIVTSLLFFVALQQGISLENNGIVEDIVYSLLNVIQINTEKINYETDKAIKNITDLSKNSIQLIYERTEAVFDLINCFEKRALDLGVNIDVCVDQKTFINQTRDDTIDSLQNTENNIIGVIENLQHETQLKFVDYLNVVQTFLQDYKKCGVMLTCIAKVISVATAESLKISSELPLISVDIINKIDLETISGIDDLTKITDEFTASSNKIRTEIIKCVVEKMPL